MQDAATRTDNRAVAGWVVAALALWSLVALSPTDVPLAVALLVGPAGISRDDLLSLVFWLGGGAVVGGVVGYGVATVATPAATTLGLGFGLAIGGGFGTAVKLVGDRQEDPGRESMTVDMAAQSASEAPTPTPEDLFVNHPDPLVFFDDAGGGPVVRAVNDAFADAFGVSAGTVEGTPLDEALMGAEGTAAVVDAAAEGEQFAGFIDFETADGTATFYVRLVAASDGGGTNGYVLYTPRSPAETGTGG